MKYLVSKHTLMLVLALVVSMLAACGGSQSATTNNASSAPVGKTNYPPIRAGLAAAEFEMLDGQKFKLADKKGKVLLINIWGIWCGPCRAEMPHLVEIQNKHRDDGVEVIGINIGDGNGNIEPAAAITKFVADMKLNYTITRSEKNTPGVREFYQQTKQGVVPQTLLVDRDGNLRGVFIGGSATVFNSMKESVAKAVKDQPA